ncbi:MAG: hypothetical protein AMJ53_00100 [Gammaproteobacteria bacterium SG8_11]|nr:MAG: hypothetical protein AMJ53_00100 [Gammaproteobacteria bacterium SG8_11]
MEPNEITITIKYDARMKTAGLWPYVVTPGRVFVKHGYKIYFKSEGVDANVRFPRSDRLFNEKHDDFMVMESGTLNPFIVTPKEPPGTVFSFCAICKHTVDGKEVEQVAEGCSSPKMIIE